MMPANPGRSQLQMMLEQMYRANAMNASPALRAPMLNDANLAAQVDAGNYRPPMEGPARQAEGNPLRIGRNVYDVPGEMQRPPSSLRDIARGALLAQRQTPRQRAHVPITQGNYSPVMPGAPRVSPEDILGTLRQRRNAARPNPNIL